MTGIDWGAIGNKVPEAILLLLLMLFVLEFQKRTNAAMDKRDEMYEKRNTALVEAIGKVTTAIGDLSTSSIKHNTEMTDAVDEMREASRELHRMVQAQSRTRPLKGN